MDDQEGHKGTASRRCHSWWYVPALVHLDLSNCSGDTDFEKTFIQCIVYNFEVLKELKDEASVKAAGKVLTKGKDYVVEDGDIILIKAGAAKA